MIIVLDSLDAADQVLGLKHIWANNGRYYVFTEQDMPKFDESIGGWVKILDHLGAPIDYSLPAAVAGNESEPITFLLSSLAGSVIQDFSGYLSASITISQFPTGAVLTVYASQDGLTNWVPAPIEAVGALSGNGMLSQISTSGAWVVPRRSRYFKIEATGFVSGDVIGQYTLSSVPLAPRAIVAHGAVSEGATKSGYPVPVGGTVRTSDTARLAGQRAEAQFSPESNLLVQIAPGASSGALPLRIGSTASGVAKPGGGTVYGYTLSNSVDAIRFLQFYNKSTNPLMGTDNPVFTVPIRGLDVSSQDFMTGIVFLNGVSWAVTSDFLGETASNPGDVVGSVIFK